MRCRRLSEFDATLGAAVGAYVGSSDPPLPYSLSAVAVLLFASGNCGEGAASVVSASNYWRAGLFWRVIASFYCHHRINASDYSFLVLLDEVFVSGNQGLQSQSPDDGPRLAELADLLHFRR